MKPSNCPRQVADHGKWHYHHDSSLNNVVNLEFNTRQPIHDPLRSPDQFCFRCDSRVEVKSRLYSRPTLTAAFCAEVIAPGAHLKILCTQQSKRVEEIQGRHALT